MSALGTPQTVLNVYRALFLKDVGVIHLNKP